jgi:hypothetical protein
MTDTAVHAGETSAGYPSHPLDPATAAEYLAGRDIMAAAGLLPEGDSEPWHGGVDGGTLRRLITARSGRREHR